VEIDDMTGKVSSKVGGVSDLLTGQIGHLRDRTAEAVRADSDSFFKQVSKLSSQLDDVESTLRKRMDRLAQQQTSRWDELTAATRRTTWPRRLFWLMVGAAAGYGAAYLGDRDRGQMRREELMQQVSTKAKDVSTQATEQAREIGSDAADRARRLAETAKEQASKVGSEVSDQADEMRRTAADSAEQVAQTAAGAGRTLADEAADQAQMTANELRGATMETAKQVTPEDVPSDPRVLEQRIRSEVFGHRNDVNAVVIKVDGPGQVALKGTVPSTMSERDLLAAVNEVEGVIDVRSELSVRHD
jgi:gas vesicle protein